MDNQRLIQFFKQIRKFPALIIILWLVSLVAFSVITDVNQNRTPGVVNYPETPSIYSDFTTWIPTSTFLNWSNNIGPYLDNDNYFLSGFTCTGSMLPILDCGDEAIFLRPPFPRHISKNDVVSFTSYKDCQKPGPNLISKAHRVVDINFRKDMRTYTTKGDANNVADPCQITNSQINGVLIGIKKGSRPKDVKNASEFHVLKLTIIELDQKYAKLLKDFKSQISKQEITSQNYQNSLDYYLNGQAPYEDMLNAYDLLNEGFQDLYAKKRALDNVGIEMNRAINQRDRLYNQLIQG